MDEDNSLEERVKAVFSKLSPSHKKLARFVLENGLFVAFAPAVELGEKVGVSAATVVRFCQTLNYEGYPELQVAVRASLPTYIQRVRQMEQGRGALVKEWAVQQVFDLDTQNLNRTLESLNSTQFSEAVAALAKATDILVIGAGLSAAPALYFAHSLKVTGLAARFILNGGIPLALELVSLKPTSVIVGISLWRYVRETVGALERAQGLGATRIAITDSVVSPLAHKADYAFQVAADGMGHSSSLTSMMSLINAFIAALSLERPEETARTLREVDAAYRAGNLVMTE